jgi:hypothetical protein
VGKQDPYIKVAVKGQTSPRSRGQTSAIMKGGTDVTFDAAHGNVLTLAYRDVAAGSPLTLLVEAFDKDAGTTDDVIGFGEVVVDTAVLSPRGRQYTCELHDSKSKPCGKVSITVSLSVAAGTAPRDGPAAASQPARGDTWDGGPDERGVAVADAVVIKTLGLQVPSLLLSVRALVRACALTLVL